MSVGRDRLPQWPTDGGSGSLMVMADQATVFYDLFSDPLVLKVPCSRSRGGGLLCLSHGVSTGGRWMDLRESGGSIGFRAWHHMVRSMMGARVVAILRLPNTRVSLTRGLPFFFISPGIVGRRALVACCSCFAAGAVWRHRLWHAVSQAPAHLHRPRGCARAAAAALCEDAARRWRLSSHDRVDRLRGARGKEGPEGGGMT